MSPITPGARRHSSASRCAAVLGAAAAVAAAATLVAAAGVFKPREPAKIYAGTAPGLERGVLVMRDEDEFRRGIAALDPPFGGEAPDLRRSTVLRVVGGRRENACRESRLLGVTTRGWNATVRIEERLPAADCACAQREAPPRAWLVVVDRAVRRARLDVTDVVSDCAEASLPEGAGGGDARIRPLVETSWPHSAAPEPGARIVTTAAAWREVCDALGLGTRCAPIDFSAERVVVVTGRARTNGCRQTRLASRSIDGEVEFVVTLEEIYPGEGQMCTQVYRPPMAYAFAVPASIESARVVTRETRR